MKAVLNGQYNGSGGLSHISIKGDLSIEGLNLEVLQNRISQLEEHIINLESVVSRLQEQNLRVNTKELAKALEEVKTETTVVEPVATVEPVAVSVSKKKTTTKEPTWY